MGSRYRRFVALLALALPGCGSILSESELRRLAEAESRWEARGFGAYSVEMRRLCFCPPNLTGWARLEVVDGALVRATILESGEVITNSQLQFWPTVEQLFEDIRHADRGSDWVADIEASYDPELGFPTAVSFRSKPEILDAGSNYSLRHARPYP